MFRAIFRKIVDVLRKSFLRKSILSVAIFFHNKSYEVIKYFVTAPGKKASEICNTESRRFF